MVKAKKKRGKGSTHQDLEARAQDILENGTILDLGSNRFRVSSQSQEDRYYDVDFLDVWKCGCPYNIHGHGDCKHIIAVQYLVMHTEPITIEKNFDIKEPDPKCTKCNSIDCKYYEKRNTLSGESIRYRCRSCKCRFTWRPGYLGRHYPANVITDILEDVVTGKSLSCAARGMVKRGYSCLKKTISRQQIWRWTRDYAKMTSGLAKVIPIKVSDKWQVDEIYFKAKNDERWLFGMMDSESRFMISSDTAPDKKSYNATNLFKDAVETAEKIPRVLISDKLYGFSRAFKKVFKKGTSAKISNNSPVHIRSVSIRHRHVHNNRRERSNGTTKDRAKTARGFNSEFPPLLRFHTFYYNFLRPHMGLDGQTPAEKAGVRIIGRDKWHTLISYSAIFCQ